MKKIIYVFLLVIMLVSLSACSKKINAIDYVTVGFSGVDTEGIAYLNIDYEKLSEDIKLSIKADDTDKIDALALIDSKINVSTAKSEMLTNEEKIIVNVEYDEEYFKSLNVSIRDTSKEVVVENLIPAIYVNPWSDDIFNQDDGVAISYVGSEPFGKLVLQNNTPKYNPISYIEYSFSKSSNLSNKELVTITAQMPNEYYQQGYLITEPTKEVILNGFSSYLTKFEDLNKEDLKNILAAGITSFEKVKDGDLFYYVNAEDYKYLFTTNINSISDFKFSQKLVYLFSKDPTTTSYYGNNLLIIPFSESVSTKASYSTKATTYENIVGYIVVSNLIRDIDGELTFDLTPVENTFYNDFELLQEMYLSNFTDSYTQNIITYEEINKIIE